MTLSDVSREAIARKQFFQELDVQSSSKSITILSNSQSILEIAENSAKYRYAKHIDIKYHAIRHYIQNNKIEIDYILTQAQSIDILMKTLQSIKHRCYIELMRLQNIYDK